MAFPPQTVYPEGIDNDYTLFLVYNTTETKICVENPAWADEIEIIPVQAGQPEIWADNGFGNISGELFYYDSVSKNSDGKVHRLKGCARNLGGTHTRHNNPGTWIRSYVVAEHHNQLLDAIFKTEDFIGYNFDPRIETLDWRIRNLEELAVIFDDFSCPDVVFTFNIIENDPITGVLAEYLIEITTTGTTGTLTFRLDFGDGDFTTTTFSGTHRYAVNSTIDPSLVISNDKCQFIVTPVVRENPAEPPDIVEEIFDIPIPEVPNVPDFVPVPCDVPEPDINLPPLVLPCVSFEPDETNIQIGSLVNVLSQVLIDGPTSINIPNINIPSTIDISGPNIPSIIFVDVPPTIVVDPPIPPTVVVTPDSNVEFSLNAASIPKLEIDWGNIPDMSVALTLPKRTRMVPVNEGALEDFGEEFADLMAAQGQMRVEVEEVGIPEEIRIIPPTMPKVEFDTKDFPKHIKIDTSEARIPEDIHIFGPEVPIPDRIQINGPNKPLPEEISIVAKDIPDSISLEADIPSTINLESNVPDRILLETVTPIPERIIMEAVGIPDELKVTGIPDTIEVTGIPDTIEVTGIPEFIPLKMPEDAQVEMVYKGAPIEVKVDLQPLSGGEDSEDRQCFMLVPCRN